MRNLTGSLALVLGLTVLSVGSTGCNKASGTSGASSKDAANNGTPKQPIIGFIYTGSKDDYGYNQAHALGAAAVKAMPGIKEPKEEERVAENTDVEKSMKSMIDIDGANLIFPTSYGYFTHVLAVAPKYPNVMFLHCGGPWTEKDPSNVGSYFGFIDEPQYLSGIVAGYMSKSKKIGFVAAKPIAQVLRNINAFTLGAQSVDPRITCTVIFTGDWSMPVKEAEATNSLCDQGIDVITCHVDSPKVVVEQADKRGIYICGYHCSQATLAPTHYLTGAEWNWEKVYTDYVKMFKEGKKIPNMLRGGLKEGIVKCSDYGPMVPDEAKKAADAVKKQFMDGTFVIFKGPLTDNKGKEILPTGKEYVQTDPALEKMDWLVAGVAGDK